MLKKVLQDVPKDFPKVVLDILLKVVLEVVLETVLEIFHEGVPEVDLLFVLLYNPLIVIIHPFNSQSSSLNPNKHKFVQKLRRRKSYLYLHQIRALIYS